MAWCIFCFFDMTVCKFMSSCSILNTFTDFLVFSTQIKNAYFAKFAMFLKFCVFLKVLVTFVDSPLSIVIHEISLSVTWVNLEPHSRFLLGATSYCDPLDPSLPSRFVLVSKLSRLPTRC